MSLYFANTGGVFQTVESLLPLKKLGHLGLASSSVGGLGYQAVDGVDHLVSTGDCWGRS